MWSENVEFGSLAVGTLYKSFGTNGSILPGETKCNWTTTKPVQIVAVNSVLLLPLYRLFLLPLLIFLHQTTNTFSSQIFFPLKQYEIHIMMKLILAAFQSALPSWVRGKLSLTNNVTIFKLGWISLHENFFY